MSTFRIIGIPMRSTIESLIVSSLLAVALATMPPLFAAESNLKTDSSAKGRGQPAAETKKAKRDWYPFGGTVVSVDKSVNTLSLKNKTGGRVLKLDAKSKLEIEGKPVTLGSIKVGSYAHGKLHKDSAGKEVITTAKFDKEAPKRTKEAANKGFQKAPTPEPEE